jgi:endonuclease YncB( thermonuclease family)
MTHHPRLLRLSRPSLPLAVVLAIAWAVPGLSAELPKQVSGPALVIDGDGFKIGEHEIRLFGIDAPEMRGGAEGRRARGELEDLIAGEPVACEPLNFDRYRRVIAICTAQGRDLGEAMLEMGWAVTYRRFLDGSPVEERYLGAERQARQAGRGLWAEDQ